MRRCKLSLILWRYRGSPSIRVRFLVVYRFTRMPVCLECNRLGVLPVHEKLSVSQEQFMFRGG